MLLNYRLLKKQQGQNEIVLLVKRSNQTYTHNTMKKNQAITTRKDYTRTQVVRQEMLCPWLPRDFTVFLCKEVDKNHSTRQQGLNSLYTARVIHTTKNQNTISTLTTIWDGNKALEPHLRARVQSPKTPCEPTIELYHRSHGPQGIVQQKQY